MLNDYTNCRKRFLQFKGIRYKIQQPNLKKKRFLIFGSRQVYKKWNKRSNVDTSSVKKEI